jgi:hypothetical protein
MGAEGPASIDAIAALVQARAPASPADRLRAAIELGRRLSETGDALIERYVAEARRRTLMRRDRRAVRHQQAGGPETLRRHSRRTGRVARALDPGRAATAHGGDDADEGSAMPRNPAPPAPCGRGSIHGGAPVGRADAGIKALTAPPQGSTFPVKRHSSIPMSTPGRVRLQTPPGTSLVPLRPRAGPPTTGRS